MSKFWQELFTSGLDGALRNLVQGKVALLMTGGLERKIITGKIMIFKFPSILWFFFHRFYDSMILLSQVYL